MDVIQKQFVLDYDLKSTPHLAINLAGKFLAFKETSRGQTTASQSQG